MSTKKSGGVNRIVRYFLAGLFAILPLLITVIAITWTLGFLGQLVGPDTFLGNQLSKIGLNFVTNPIVAYGIGWIGICIGTLIPGFLVESGMRGLFSKLPKRLPKDCRWWGRFTTRPSSWLTCLTLAETTS